jgi:Uri superfamily endonuclease
MMLGAVIVPGKRPLECILAERLGDRFEVPVPRFGSGGCRCEGHLFFAARI